MSKRIIIVILIVIIGAVTVTLFSKLGINATNSVGFRFYYHTAFNPSSISTGDYLMFDMPPNELYPTDTNVIKQVACMPQQYLKAVAINDELINYYCDDELVSSTTLFKTSNQTQLYVCMYDGIIPKNSYFMIGSSEDSYDSKYWGFVTSDRIKRKVYPLVNLMRNVAYANDKPSGFYQGNHATGFYKYIDEPIKEEAEEQPQEEQQQAKPFVMPEIDWERVSTMPPTEFSELFTDVEHYAMSHRTLANFDTYAKLRDVMFDRATEFANVADLWRQLNPESSEASWYPQTGYAQKVYYREKTNVRRQYLADNSERFGLLYFYRKNCAYCTAQEPAVSFFERDAGWSVLRIDADESPEGAMRFNVTTVPALILVDRDTDKSLPVSMGITAANVIEDKLYKTIRYLKGESNETDYAEPINPLQARN